MRLPTHAALVGLLASISAAQFQFVPLGKNHLSTHQWASVLGVADLDGDRRPDLLVSSEQQWRVQRNLGETRFAELRGAFPTASHRYAFQAVLGDFDGDGDQDVLAVPNTHLASSARPGLYLNDGRGTFRDVSSMRALPTATVTRAAVVLDADGDGDVDVFCGNIGTNGLWLNDGAGNFRLDRRRLPTTSEPTSAAAAADIDGDGDVDLAFSSGDLNGAATVVLRNASGFFSPIAGIPAQTEVATRLVWLDIDGDRDADLIFAHADYVTAFPEPMAVWRNDGAAGFRVVTGSALPPGGFETYHVTTGDIDSDGRIDLVVGDWRAPGGVDVLRNLGNGTFRPVAGVGLTRRTPFPLFQAHARDLDGDGHVDLVDGNRLWLNNQRGGLDQASGSTFAGYSTVPVDLDRDGDLDLLMDGRVHANDGSGALSVVRGALPSLQASEQAGAVGDLDGDGDPDLLLAHQLVAPGSGQNRLLLQGAGVVFSDRTATHLPQRMESSVDVELFDADGDGDLDACIANRGFVAPFVPDRLLLNDGTGRMTDAPSSAFPAPADPSNAVVAGDVDGDGDLDLIVAAGRRGASALDQLWLNDGRGRFQLSPGLLVQPGISSGVVLGDVDGDGDLDCVLTRQPLGTTQVTSVLLRNNGRGFFTDRTATDWPHAVGSRSGPLLVDLDDDGDLDLVTTDHPTPVVSTTTSVEVWWNDGSGRFRAAGAAVTEQIPGSVRIVGAGDVDSDGDVDLISDYGLLASTMVDLRTPYLAIPGRAFRFRVGYSPVSGGAATAVLLVGGRPMVRPVRLGPVGSWFVDPALSVALPPIALRPPMSAVDLDLRLPTALGFGAAFSAQGLVVPGAASARWRITPPVFESVQR